MKKYYYFLLLVIMSGKGIAQQPTFNAQFDLGFSFIGLSNVFPTDSCYYATGFIQEMNGQEYVDGSAFFKFDLNGSNQILTTLINQDKVYYITGKELVPTNDGNFATCGITISSTIKSLFIIYKPNGDILLKKEYLSPNFPVDSIKYATSLKKTINNQYYLMGHYFPSKDSPIVNIYILKLDSVGNVLQTKTYDAYSYGHAGSMMPTADGGLIIGACKTNIDVATSDFIRRAYIFKVNSLGEIVWEYLSPEGELQDIVYSMVESTDGGIIAASGKGVELDLMPNLSEIVTQGYVFKLDATHQLEWETDLRGTRGMPSDVMCKRVIPTLDGTGYVICGNVLEKESSASELYGSWIVKVSNQGDSLWTRYYTLLSGPDRPSPLDFKLTPDGGYVVAGYTQQGPEFGWLMKLDGFGCLIPGCNANDGPNATSEEKAEIKLAIYPNPTADFLNFELRAPQLPQKARFRIYDASGKLVKEFKTDNLNSTFIVAIHDWPNGMYWLQCMDGEKIVLSEKFIKQ